MSIPQHFPEISLARACEVLATDPDGFADCVTRFANEQKYLSLALVARFGPDAAPSFMGIAALVYRLLNEPFDVAELECKFAPCAARGEA